MGRILSIIFTIIITSFYFFPFCFTFLPSVNTKMAMAAFGLVLLGIQLGKARNSVLNKNIFILSIFAAKNAFLNDFKQMLPSSMPCGDFPVRCAIF